MKIEYRIVREMFHCARIECRIWWCPFWTVCRDKLTIQQAEEIMQALIKDHQGLQSEQPVSE